MAPSEHCSEVFAVTHTPGPVVQCIRQQFCFTEAYYDLQAELLEALEEEHKQQESKKASKKKKKLGLKGSDKADSTDSRLTEMGCLTGPPESALPPACSKCAILQGSTRPTPRPGKKGSSCSSCLDCKVAADKSAKQPISSRASFDSAPPGPASPDSQTLSLPSSLQRMSSGSSSSDHSSSSNSLPSSGSKSPAEPGTPGSLSSDGWEVQQRSKRTAPSEKQGSDISHSIGSQPRACRTVIAPHPALAAAWHPAPGSASGSSPGTQKPLMKDVLVHHVHATPATTEVLHLASGPVTFQPPPPPPPPRTRAARADSGGVKVQHGFSPTVGNAWSVPGKMSTYALGAKGSAWAPDVHQVCFVCIVPARPASRLTLLLFYVMDIKAWRQGQAYQYACCRQLPILLVLLNHCSSCSAFHDPAKAATLLV